MSFIKKVERELIFRKNLKLFEEKLPPVAEAVKKVKTPIRIQEKKGKLDAFIEDVSIYGGDAWALVQKQLELFDKLQPKLFSSVSLEPPPPREDIIAFKYTHKLYQIIGQQNTYTLPPLKEGGFIPLLIVVGVGFGMHIKELMERYHIQNLILVDVPLYFRLSLYWLDWEWVFDQYSDGKKQLHIVLTDNKYSQKHPDEAYEPILRAIQGMNPATAWFSYYFQHLAYEPPLKPIEWLREHPILRQLLYGYFDDELWSLDWTIEKVVKGVPMYYGDVKVPKGSVAFVLGAGPSLDRHMDLLEKYKDKVVIVSCGSTITSLEKVGLKPDIHVELERTKYTYDMLSEVDPNFLKGIFLVTTNTVWTQCFDLFEEGGFVLKSGDTGREFLRLLGIKAPDLANISPTVTAMGVSLCASLGFEEVYLLGVDLGSKDPKLHHSKKSNYYNPKSMLSKVPVELNKAVPGNFGGTVYTNFLFEETGYAIHKTIYQTGIKVYNMSDGIRIKDAIPLDPEDLDIRTTPKKEGVLKAIKSNFRSDYVGKINPKEPLEELYKVFLKAEEVVRSLPKPKDLVEAFYHMVIIEKLIQSMGRVGYMLVFHNTYQWSVSVVGYMLKLDETEALSFMKEFLDLYADFLKEAGQSIKALLEKDYSI